MKKMLLTSVIKNEIDKINPYKFKKITLISRNIIQKNKIIHIKFIFCFYDPTNYNNDN